jgi:ferredoxin
VPANQRDFIALNAELAPKWKRILKTKPSLPDADAWAKVDNKRTELQR